MHSVANKFFEAMQNRHKELSPDSELQVHIVTPDATSAQGLIQTSNGAFDRLATMLADLILRIRAAKQTVRAARGRSSTVDHGRRPQPAPQALAGQAVYSQATSSMRPDRAGRVSYLHGKLDTYQVDGWCSGVPAHTAFPGSVW